LKLVTICIALILLFVSVTNGDYRISAKSVLEGTVQRSVIAPFDGYLYEAPVRAGDIVTKGQLLANLDSRDLMLQRLKWSSQHKQHTLEFNKALARNEIVESKIIRELINQAESELSLLDEQIKRAEILVPFDGIAITGDWSQSIGTPIERGQVLFQIAPLNSYRVMLEVAEGDIDQVAVGQKGDLVLNAMPDTPYAFMVEKISTVTTTRDGSNFFLVEGRILQDSKKLRPGMHGYGKIFVERRKLIWIWMHDLIDWIRIWFWKKVS
jgi:multidrug resistance efflux pump